MNAFTHGLSRFFEQARSAFNDRNLPQWSGHTQFLAESEDYADLERRLDLVQQHPNGVPLVLMVGTR